MAEKVIAIEGGYKLNGTVRISGAKNATVALIPATVLADEPIDIYGVPEISDVEALGILLRELKCKVDINGEHIKIDPTHMENLPLVSDAVNKLRASYYFMGALLGKYKKVCKVDINGEHIKIDPTHMENLPLVSDAVNKLRASYYFMGALLGKYKKVVIRMPGGCYLGPRPIDLHLKGFEALGAKITYEGETCILEAEELIGERIYLDFASVGATINIMLAAVKAKGKTIIENAAKEPEIIDVANLLTKMGAKIRGVGTDTITIEGVESLHGTFHEIIPDRIEAGTFLVIAAAAGEKVIIQNIIPQHLEALISKLKEMGTFHEIIPDRIEAGTFLVIAAAAGEKVIIQNIIPQHLEALISKLKEMGVQMEVVGDSIVVYGGVDLKAVDIKTQIYPGFATDLQQPLTTLLTQASGESHVQETIYIERFKHCEQLNKMGANIKLEEARSTIHGPTPLHGARVMATDLRCGAALVVAGLIAKGKTEITNVYHIDRGYDNIDHKLITLGAHITRYEIDE